MLAEPAQQALTHFLRDGPSRIAWIADPQVASAVALPFKPAAASIARQASGGWIVARRSEAGFGISSALRTFAIGEAFDINCQHVANMVLSSRNPDLRALIARIEDPLPAILSAFFHYFAIHEFLHIEQGLGSDQYADSDLYMPIVMEADHVADVAGLAIAIATDIPELVALDTRERMLLLVAVHIASMHSFSQPDQLDSYAFSRLLVWYLHFARFTKSAEIPDLASPTMLRPWIVALPRLVGQQDHVLTSKSLTLRAAHPYGATSDVVLAYHQEDGLYRIHRAALTDPARIHRVCQSILKPAFDSVREDLEELLVNNPALIPSLAARRAPGVEWAAGAVIEQLEAVRLAIPNEPRAAAQAADAAFLAFTRMIAEVRTTAAPSSTVTQLISDGRVALERLCETLESDAPSDVQPSTWRRRALSIVDQIVIEHSAD